MISDTIKIIAVSSFLLSNCFIVGFPAVTIFILTSIPIGVILFLGAVKLTGGDNERRRT